MPLSDDPQPWPAEAEVQAKVKLAVARLLDDDRYLFQNNVNERSISHHLACYLQERFSGWHVDVEYNRNHDDPKRLTLPPPTMVASNDTEATTVFPDLIVHRRDTDHNLLVIEIKKNRESDAVDMQKLRAFKAQLHYRFALFLRFRVGNEEPGVAV